MFTLSCSSLDNATGAPTRVGARERRKVFAGGRKIGIAGLAILAVTALGIDPEANAAPSPCPQGPAPGPGPGCGRHAFLADVSAAGFGNGNGDSVAIQQGLDICGLMDAGLSRQNMVSQFAAD